MAYRTFGIHRATTAGMAPVYTNIWLKRMNNIYVKLNAMPIPMFHPIPPLFFLDERVTPMMVRMNAENGIEYL